MNDFTVSVVIVNFNGALYIEKCLDSFVKQNRKPDEILIVDNNSQDNSVEFIKKSFPQVNIIKSPENNGYGAALNIGIKNSKGNILILGNNDLCVDPFWLDNILKEFTEHKNCGLAASKVLYMDEPQKINSTGMLFYKDMSAVNRGLDEIDKGQYDNREEVFGAYGVLMAFRKEVFDKIGLFDEDYFLFREEDEFMWRMRRHGWITRYAPAAKVFHKRSANTKLFSPLKLYYSERNRFFNVLKYMPLRCNFTMLPFALYRYWINFMLAFTQGRTKKSEQLKITSKILLMLIIFKAWMHAFYSFPKMYKKRKLYNKNAVFSYKQSLKWMKVYSASARDMLK